LENLVKMTSARRSTREFVEEMAFRDGRRVSLLAEGRPVNMTAGEGHPAAVMDVSFANQALSVEWILRSHSTLEGKVYPVPDEIDKQVARMKLESLGVKLDRLTPDQEAYLGNWQGE
jgi:adenosylhomocysteinase